MPTLDGLIVTNAGGGSGTPTSIVGPTNAPASGRGVIVQLGLHTGVNLNSVAQTIIFTTPGSGFFLCVPTLVVVDNFSGAVTTNAASFGSSGTPTDFLASTVLTGGAAGKSFQNAPASFVTACAVYGAGINFVMNVTAGGAAISADVYVFGYYHG